MKKLLLLSTILIGSVFATEPVPVTNPQTLTIFAFNQAFCALFARNVSNQVGPCHTAIMVTLTGVPRFIETIQFTVKYVDADGMPHTDVQTLPENSSFYHNFVYINATDVDHVESVVALPGSLTHAKEFNR